MRANKASFFETSGPIIQQALEAACQPLFTDQRQVLDRALHYVLCQSGKQFRPKLVLASQRLFSSDFAPIMPVAVALEQVHCFSLVHDDLPAMDDDDLRRGQASCHKAFDEATAILTGDALLSLAYEGLAKDLPAYFPADKILLAIQCLARAIGSQGLIGGQILDMQHTGSIGREEDIEVLHQAKTGALIEAAILMPAYLNEASESHCQALKEFARHLGLLFQIRDDILDACATSEELGKTAGKDALQEKVTYVALLGLAKAKEKARQEFNQAEAILRAFEPESSQNLADCLARLQFKKKERLF